MTLRPRNGKISAFLQDILLNILLLLEVEADRMDMAVAAAQEAY
jgi:hypothetical protein